MPAKTLAPLDLQLRVMTMDDARQVAGWRYAELCDRDRLLDRDRAYYSLVNARDEVVGCCCFGPEARVPGGDYTASGLDIAAWLRPDLTGYGRGARFVITVLTFARALFGPLTFRVTIPAASTPALKACRRAGFQPSGSVITPDAHAYQHLTFDASLS